MATYIALIDFTEQGIRSIQESPNRATAFAERANAMGITVKDVYWTTGAHDGVLIIDAPSDESASKLFLTVAREGNIRTHTLRAFDRTEMMRILGDA